MSNERCTTLYVGAISNIKRRTLQHKSGHGSKFTSKYNLAVLLYYEELVGMVEAYARESQLKNWHRDWKWNLIKERNPDLRDLSDGWYVEGM